MNRQLLSELDFVPYSQIKKLPCDVGVYFICLNDSVLYVGSAKNIRSRMMSHHKTADITRVTRWACEHKLTRKGSTVIRYKTCDTLENARLLEKECIANFVPTLNWIESRENYIKHLEQKAKVQFLN